MAQKIQNFENVILFFFFYPHFWGLYPLGVGGTKLEIKFRKKSTKFPSKSDFFLNVFDQFSDFHGFCRADYSQGHLFGNQVNANLWFRNETYYLRNYIIWFHYICLSKSESLKMFSDLYFMMFLFLRNLILIVPGPKNHQHEEKQPSKKT